MRSYLTAIAAALLLVGCSQVGEMNWAVMPGADSYVLEYGTGRLPRQKKVNLRESEKALLRTYAQELAEEGEITPVTYAPQFVLSGEHYSLNFGQDVVVLNIWQADGSNGRQFSRRRCPADDEVLALLRRRTAERTLRR